MDGRFFGILSCTVLPVLIMGQVAIAKKLVYKCLKDEIILSTGDSLK